MNRVINVKYLNKAERTNILYVGRNPKYYGFTRALPALANKFRVGIHGPQGECILLYEAWLRECIEMKNLEVLNALYSINHDDILGCWCKPKACHADIIAMILESLVETPQSSL
jgi:hypothetical protein